MVKSYLFIISALLMLLSSVTFAETSKEGYKKKRNCGHKPVIVMIDGTITGVLNKDLKFILTSNDYSVKPKPFWHKLNNKQILISIKRINDNYFDYCSKFRYEDNTFII